MTYREALKDFKKYNLPEVKNIYGKTINLHLHMRGLLILIFCTGKS